MFWSVVSLWLYFPLSFLFFSHCTRSSTETCLGFREVHNSGAHHIPDTKTGCPVLSGIHIRPLFAHFRFGVISLWVSLSGKNVRADTHTLTADISASTCMIPNMIVGFSIHRNGQHCHAGPVLPYPGNAKQHVITAPCDRRASAEEADNNKLMWSGFEGENIGQRSFEIRDECYRAFWSGLPWIQRDCCVKFCHLIVPFRDNKVDLWENIQWQLFQLNQMEIEFEKEVNSCFYFSVSYFRHPVLSRPTGCGPITGKHATFGFTFSLI